MAMLRAWPWVLLSRRACYGLRLPVAIVLIVAVFDCDGYASSLVVALALL